MIRNLKPKFYLTPQNKINPLSDLCVKHSIIFYNFAIFFYNISISLIDSLYDKNEAFRI